MDVETINHILLTSTVSWSIQISVLEWWDFQRVFPRDLQSMICVLQGFMQRKSFVVFCVVLGLWYECNKVKFEQVVPSRDHMIRMLQIRVRI